MTEAQKDTLRTRYEYSGSQTYVDEDGNSYTVHVMANSWRCEPRKMAGDILYWVRFSLVEE